MLLSSRVTPPHCWQQPYSTKRRSQSRQRHKISEYSGTKVGMAATRPKEQVHRKTNNSPPNAHSVIKRTPSAIGYSNVRNPQ